MNTLDHRYPKQPDITPLITDGWATATNPASVPTSPKDSIFYGDDTIRNTSFVEQTLGHYASMASLIDSRPELTE